MKLANPDDVVAFMGLSRDIADYPALEIIQDNVEISLSSFLGLDLEEADRVVSIKTDGHMVALKALPVASVAKVAVTAFGGSSVVLQPSQYTIMPYGMRLHARYSGVVEISYIGGLKALPNGIMDVPPVNVSHYRFCAALRKAALMQIVYEFERKDSIGSTTLSTDGGRKTFAEITLLKAVKDLLIEFRHPLTGFQ